MSDQRVLDRRGFLKGSALFAAAAGLSLAAPAAAQSAAGQESALPAPSEDKKAEPPKQDAPAEAKKKTLVDNNGREYRICDMCGGNMYVTEKMWTCEQCGFAYEV
jgi:anaerobic selenocysteine-containing dehydrogenase